MSKAERVRAQKETIMVDRDAKLRVELRTYLDNFIITGDNIGEIRRGLFVPWDSAWNGWVRDETASREIPSPHTELKAEGDHAATI